LVPRLALELLLLGDLNKLEAKQSLKDAQHLFNGVHERKVIGNFLSIESIVLLQHEVIVESVIPEVVVVGIGLLGILQFKQLGLLLLSSRSQLFPQVAQEFLNLGLALCHSLAKNKVRVRVESKHASLLVSEDNSLFED